MSEPNAAALPARSGLCNRHHLAPASLIVTCDRPVGHSTPTHRDRAWHYEWFDGAATDWTPLPKPANGSGQAGEPRD